MRVYEQRDAPILPHTAFLRRVVRHLLFTVAIIFLALALGVLGYRYLNGEPWVDAVLDASMILGGMGPVSELRSDGAKLFASFYALFSGLTFISVAGVMVAPFAHRILHSFHLAEEGDSAD